ncbi:insulinase family protein [Taibaiella lutea]|uniref:Insulinase family protein n=1 Tax=Taibaiella lutea TaxID=2608001 RepID=A0A5M6CRN7_9BACT|nr:pitrilysin family protein [Taibaiella lutea]KAA5536612.1 insulinase family protein [Taibaiella lutea]
MIQFERFNLANGLRVILHQDLSTPMVAFNILYDVGARDEDPERTGFAHLFEHLMFGGSENIPSYDEPLQMAGGENNAYTTNDITNYYIQLPKENIETAFWLESDRMLSLAFNENSLDVQRKVVSEEFKEHYINKPYGDAWNHLRKLAYKQHPYQWMTIGKELKHIEEAQLQDVKDFFFKHYRPQNAVICVAGNTTLEEVKNLTEKWFANIPAGEKYERNIPEEPKQNEPREATVTADVPYDALYKVWHIGGRLDPQYYPADIITEILGSGHSSRLYQRLVKEQHLFSNISCYHTGSTDPGLLVIEGKLIEGITVEKADAAILHEINLLKTEGISEEELEKAKNKVEAMMVFEDMNLLARANNFAFYELLGDANLMNEELDKYLSVTMNDLKTAMDSIFIESNCSTLKYLSKNLHS